MTVSLIQEELVEALDGESASAKVLGWEREQVSGIWSHHFMANRWGNNGNRADFIFSGSNITADGDCSHEIKKRLLLGRKATTNLAAAAAAAKSLQSCPTPCNKRRQRIKKQRHYFTNKGPYGQSYGFPISHVWM